MSHLRPLKHGHSFEAWKSGEMRAIVSCQPQGVHAGDGYTEYEGLNAGTDTEIYAMFQHESYQFKVIDLSSRYSH